MFILERQGENDTVYRRQGINVQKTGRELGRERERERGRERNN